MSRNDIELKKLQNIYKKDSRIKECFHYDHNNCSENIVSAHSIQRKGVLDLLEYEVDGNHSVYSFLYLKYSQSNLPVGFKPLGKKSASTFFGFCGYHDNNLFSSIENNEVNLDNDEHCFLLSYRAFAKDYHAKYETLKGYRNNQFYQKKVKPEITEGLVMGSELGLRDFNLAKSRLNEILKNKQFNELSYSTHILDYAVPIALSASITPEYSYKDEILNLSDDPNDIYEYVNFIIHPTLNGKTNILLSCLPEHLKSIKFIDQIHDLNPLRFKKAISSIAISQVENTFISPLLWNKLNPKEKEILMNELWNTVPFLKEQRFFHSKLNLLDNRFKLIIDS